MEESLVTQVTRYLKNQRRRKIGYQILTCMASVVVFCTVYALILPAITISNELTCGLEQHEHDESCYAMAPAVPQPELICDTSDLPGLILHTHNSYCYDNDGNLICTLTEREAHTHDRSCYEERQNLICDQVQDLGHTHTSACYARDRGELICTIPEGEGAHTHTDECIQVTEKQVLSCGKTEEPAHTHDESCYTTRTKKVLVCTESEEPAHTHDDSCYTEEETERLVCSESERPEQVEDGVVVDPGHSHSGSCYERETKRVLTCTESTAPAHRHTDACYETEEETVLTCTLRESEGHTHDESCYTTETETTYLCGQEESKGHVHTDSCYEWTERLTCTEEERPAGHIHDDSCYEKETVLACHKMEIEEHIHGESCYNEEGELTCTRREVSSHQHTAACVYIPENTGEEVLTLICGKEEHIHNEACYVDIVPPEDQEFYCGIPAHTHTDECYHGEILFCTMPEHVHTEECRQPPVPEVPKFAGAEGVELDNDFTYENDAFLVNFHITGYAPLLYDEEPMTLTDEGLYSAAPLSGDGAESDSAPAPEPEPDVPEVPSVPDVPDVPETPAADGEAGSDDSYGGFAGDEDFGAGDEPADNTVLLNSEDVEFTVETLSEDSREYQQMASHAEEFSSDQELPMLEVLSFSAMIEGQELDLSGCTVEVEVTLSELLMEYLNSYSEASSVMAIDDVDFEEVVDGDETVESEELVTDTVAFTLMSYAVEKDSGEVNEIGSVSTAEGDTVNGTMGQNDDNKVVIALLPRIYPNYTIEFYANLNRPVTNANPVGAVEPAKGVPASLPFLDTSSGKNGGKATLPTNSSLPQTNLWLDKDKRVLTQKELTEIYQAKEKLIFNPLVETTDQQLTVERLNALRENPNYTVKELWVLQPGEDPGDEEHAGDWTVYPEARLDDLRFTNNPAAAEANENVILIQQEGTENTILRLIYEPYEPEETKDYEAVFYDYDVTDGEPKGTTVNVEQKGINSQKNYGTATAGRFAFGNSNNVLKSGLGDEKWNGNYLNQAGSGYYGCNFGLVQGMETTENGMVLHFKDGIHAPDLFGTNKPDSEILGKKTLDGYSLSFKQQGDTYWLTSVQNKEGTTVLSGADVFNHNQNGWGGKVIHSNSFWPLDDVYGADPHFGKKDNVIKTNPDGTLLNSDDGGEHNAYFGMTFAVEFRLEEEYMGPLEYYFYGDDDMWVFLDDQQLVCDIGGVHQSVGEYVDLWDYIPGGRENHAAGPHTLYFFYTERGAGGSTCWMQFTLPSVVSLPGRTPPDGEAKPLRIEKAVTGSNAPDPDTEYTFSIKLTGGMTNNFGGFIYNADGTPVYEADGKEQKEVTGINCTTETEFTLKAGQYFEIYGGLPTYAGYIVKERLPDGLSDEVVDMWSPSVDTTWTDKDGKKTTATTAGPNTEGNIGSNQVVVRYTNAFNYELPETGGTGTILYTLTGALLPAVTGGLWYRKKKSKREGAVD